MGLISRIFRPSASKHAEGQYRDGPYWPPITGGWLSAEAGRYANWWQLGYDPVGGGTTAMVETCVSSYAQTIAMCPGDHWRATEKGGRERVTNSALSRILRRPNPYQSISDFLLNATRSLYLDGNAYALALRNDRYEIAELHLMHPRQCGARIAETGDVFYYLAGNEIIERRLALLGGGNLIVPARDVLHIRLHTPRHPLHGETPLQAAAMDVAASGAISQQQVNFYLNQARPSNALTTDQVLTQDQVKQLRELWDQQSRGLNVGGTPILTAGLKPVNLSMTAQDAQLAEMLKLTEQHVALVFRIPLQILGIGGTPYASTELLMQSWIASGLGFALNHIEEAFGLLFNLKGMPDEYLEFNTAALLRSAMKDRIEALTRGVQGGIYSPNEARAEESLPSAEFGDEPRVQQQVVPLSAAKAIPSAPPAPPAPPAPAYKPDDEEPEGTSNDNERMRQSFRSAHARHVAL
jgi:HK97 family phage portal protein